MIYAPRWPRILIEPVASATLRARLALALLLITPLGFATKFYEGPGGAWVEGYAGGVLYEIFWMLVVVMVAPQSRPGVVASAVFSVTAVLETLQLWQPPLLQALRATFLGRTLIGDTFSWWDFPHYALGCAAGYLLLRGLRGAGR